MSTLDELFQRLVGEDEEDCLLAGFELHKFGKPAVEGALKLTNSSNPVARDWACFVLGRVLMEGIEQDIVYPTYYNYGVPKLLELLKNDPEPSVRSSAATALGQHKIPGVLKFLCEAAYDADTNTRFGVTLGRGCFGSGSWNRDEVIRIIEQTEAAFLHLSRDEDEDVRDWTALAISHIAHKSEILRARLVEMTNDSSEIVADEAKDSLQKVIEYEYKRSIGTPGFY